MGGMAGQIRKEPREKGRGTEHDRSTGTALTPPVLEAALRTRPRAVIFDMDGLLVDSERTTRDVWRASTRDCGFVLSDETYLSLIGLGAEEADRVLAGHFGDGFVVDAFRERRIIRMRELLASGGAPFKPGAREALAWVAGLRIPIGLATSSRRHEVRDRLGEVADLFTTITTREDARRGKPHPDIYLAAAARLGVLPSECLAIEDSFAGVRAATAAGIPVVMVPDLAQPTTEIRGMAAAVYASLIELRASLESAWSAE
jgi:HAD superfamily hydrolase (TIGR01509 family)